MKQTFDYPVTRRDEIVEDYHGTVVADPYRWLEDPQATETQSWIAAQNELTRDYLDEISVRQQFKQRLTALWDYDKFSVPVRRGDNYYFSRLSGLQNQPILFKQRMLDSDPELLLNPNTLSADGTVAVTSQVFSKDGSLLAYGTSSSGSDWQEYHIRRTHSGRDYDEVIEWCKFAGLAWLLDNSGFFYNRYPEPPEGKAAAYALTNNKVYFHEMGTPQEADVLVYQRPDEPELDLTPAITDDGRYLLIYGRQAAASRNRLYYRDLKSNSPFIPLVAEEDALYSVIGNDDHIFYIHTDWQAPHGRIMAVDLTRPEREHWRDLVPEQKDVLDFVTMTYDQFVIGYMHNAYHQIKVYGRDGAFVREIDLPTMGSIVGLSGRREHSELFVSFQSFIFPTTQFRYDFISNELTTFRESDVRFDPTGYETRQVFYESKDGTPVSLFITHKKGLDMNGQHPTLLYGYGGFSVNITPSFGLTTALWLEFGGVYALANLRGGNEYGDEWHTAGMLENKQNVFDDFIAAAEWLIANGYTNSQQLGIMGGSNGGLLVSACMLQRPDLFGAVVCSVPVTDMLRYHRFTAGRYWVYEYGDAENNPEHFRFLYAYSPLHNIGEGVTYPPILITTADTDDRVMPLHSFKLAAALQAASPRNNPILLRVETKAGHGLGKPTSKIIDESSDVYAFLLHNLVPNESL